MLITCPICNAKARISSSKSMSEKTREIYCQCLNLNCASVFVSLISLSRMIRRTGRAANPRLQPNLYQYCHKSHFTDSNRVCNFPLESSKVSSPNDVFIQLQNASGMMNIECGEYLGISEGAVKDRRRGVFTPRRCELIALAIYGNQAGQEAIAIL